MPKPLQVQLPPPPKPKARPSMTVLQYVCGQLLGEPIREGAPGESYFDCPFCGSSKFHTLPHRPEYKDRWKCWACGERGDVFDLLAWAYPHEDFGQRRNRLTFLQMDYERATGVRLDTDGSEVGEATGAFPSGECAPRPTLDKARTERLVTDAAERLWRPYQTLEPGTSGGLEWREFPEHPVLVWLRQRGLTDATIKAARLGTSTEGSLFIPWFGQNGVQAVNVRHFADAARRYQLLRGSRKGIAYPEHRVDGRPVLIAEGELDVLVARQELSDLAQCITFGGVADRVPQELLPLLGQRVVIVGYDADQAGDNGFEMIRSVLPQAKRMRPARGKDLTEQHAATGLRSWFDHCRR
jgi:hypothetical protein